MTIFKEIQMHTFVCFDDKESKILSEAYKIIDRVRNKNILDNPRDECLDDFCDRALESIDHILKYSEYTEINE